MVKEISFKSNVYTLPANASKQTGINPDALKAITSRSVNGLPDYEAFANLIKKVAIFFIKSKK